MRQSWTERTVATFERLLEIDRRSRVMLTFMTSHMKEVTGPLGVDPARYFKECYGDVAQEFFQAAENSFVTHHCARLLHGRWLDQLAAAGKAGVPVPALEADVMAGGAIVVPSTYADVAGPLAQGTVPELVGPRNQMMAPEGCSIFGRDDLIFGALEVQSAVDWAEQTVLMWGLVRDAAALAQAGAGADLGDTGPLVALYEEWREFHIASARIHSELFGRFSAGMFGLVGEQAGMWALTPVLLHEMYLETADAMAALTGEGQRPALPALAYWRRTPWTPALAAPGAPGLPPF